MRAWFGGRKSSSKNKQQLSESTRKTSHSGSRPIDRTRAPERPNSLDESLFCPTLTISPRSSREFAVSAGGVVVVGGSPSGFSGFDSDGTERTPLPLPRPSISSLANDHAVNLGSGSASVSSVSSSGSSDDVLAHDRPQFSVFRGNVETKPKSRSKSPVPGSRGLSSSVSPRHPRLSGSCFDSPSGKHEEGENICHRLPLPPGSPPSPSALCNPRISGFSENAVHVLPKWQKGRLLGRGTFGHVYLGFNSESGQMCAIKEVRVVSDDQTSKECLKQLNQEISLLSQLSHPNIVQYYGSNLGEESLSVYLEYVSGGSIHKLLQEYGAFKEPVIQNYTRQILSGLAYLHGRNTVHRDIKGANILVDPNGEIKLADFGMAKHITACSSILSFKGSPYWMAPEVVMNTNGYSLPVDIWSLGCLFLEMATSKPPWGQYEGVAAIFKIGNSKDIPEIPEHLSIHAKSFVMLCLQRDPSARPTASGLLDHPFIQNQPKSGPSNGSVTRDAVPFSFDGCRTPSALDIHPRRKSVAARDGEYSAKQPVINGQRMARSPREQGRTITSLPVSPCSSPLRNAGPVYRSSMLSPQHPMHAMNLMGQGGYYTNGYSTFPASQNPRYTLDPWFEAPLRRAQTPPRRDQ